MLVAAHDAVDVTLINWTLLPRAGRVTIAGSRRQIFESLRREQPDLVVVHDRLLDACGARLLPEIKRHAGAARVILIAALTGPDQLAQAFAHADSVVPRPVSVDALGLALDGLDPTADLTGAA